MKKTQVGGLLPGLNHFEVGPEQWSLEDDASCGEIFFGQLFEDGINPKP